MHSQLVTHIVCAISDATHHPFTLRKSTPVSGGSISAAFRLEGTDGTRYFVKLNDEQHHPMFSAEAAALDAIAATKTICAPRPIVHGCACEQCYLALEHLELTLHGDAKRLGEQLAALHRCQASQFGFAQDNFIGTTPQANECKDDWMVFWREQRLGYQLRLAAENGYSGQLQSMGKRLMETLPAFFENHSPQPSLLHGDLWGGNHAFLSDGTPTIFDPASYYGDRECDLAMTELFGGYPANFYAAYRAAWPLDEGYATRRELYNLYHILNHANLFGGGYVRQAERIIEKLLSGI